MSRVLGDLLYLEVSCKLSLNNFVPRKIIYRCVLEKNLQKKEDPLYRCSPFNSTWMLHGYFEENLQTQQLAPYSAKLVMTPSVDMTS
jgi:hypothetical protein